MLADFEHQSAGDDVKELNSRVLVFTHMGSLGCFELGVVGVQLPVLRAKVQTLEEIRGMPYLGRFRETETLPPSHNFNYRFGLGIEKILQPDAKTSAMRRRVGRVGCIRSRSSFDSSDGERPVCLLSSLNP